MSQRKPFEPFIVTIEARHAQFRNLKGDWYVSVEEANAAIAADEEHHRIVSQKWKESNEALRAEIVAMNARWNDQAKDYVRNSVEITRLEQDLARAEEVIRLVVKNAELLEGEDLMDGEKLARDYFTSNDPSPSLTPSGKTPSEK